ncbi:MAG TPA: macro domain-containing protein [Gemmatimonadaceae bacterium]|nr:macro domain-containing protein [Gemmatimonadaceae bacterium]
MIEIVIGDITNLAVDAVVNAANGALRGGGGVDGAIHQAAGPQLLTELKLFPGCATGDAVITRGYRLPAKYIIHAVGPVWHGGVNYEASLLAKTYESAFARAKEAGDIKTIAFPAISTGVYHFPKAEAAMIAVRSMVGHEREYKRIVACAYDDVAAAFYKDALGTMRMRKL